MPDVMKGKAGRLALATGFLGTILAANWLTTSYGFVPVGFGLVATAGTFAAGVALAFRDAVHDLAGRRIVLALILVGAGLSFAIADPFIALASGVAFLISELADFAVYAPLRRRSRLGDRRWAAAVVSSNIAGALVDTAIFLGIAFGAAAILPAIPGQMVGKGWATVLYLAAGWVIARAVLRQPVLARRA